jgi:hypothetical protein
MLIQISERQFLLFRVQYAPLDRLEHQKVNPSDYLMEHIFDFLFVILEPIQKGTILYAIMHFHFVFSHFFVDDKVDDFDFFIYWVALVLNWVKLVVLYSPVEKLLEIFTEVKSSHVLEELLGPWLIVFPLPDTLRCSILGSSLCFFGFRFWFLVVWILKQNWNLIIDLHRNHIFRFTFFHFHWRTIKILLIILEISKY